ncbi:MAG: DUF4418 family protein [Clostridiales Family XIII bacterium]|nr:DUF4418 family protein [Clostridiales Family XIII bacterium]
MVTRIKDGGPKEKQDRAPSVIVAVMVIIGLATAVLPKALFLRLEYEWKDNMDCVLTQNIELFVGCFIAAFAIQYFIKKSLKQKFIFSIIIIVLGIAAIVTPLFAGLCDDPDMACRAIIFPILIVLGALTIISGIIAGRLAPRAVANQAQHDD